MHKLITSLLSLGLTLAQAGELVEFQPNTPARADQVNANFDALQTAIQSNANAIAEIDIRTDSIPGTQVRSVDCTGNSPDAEFASIRDALTNASPGSLTVIVNGICTEDVTISGIGDLTLTGDDSNGFIDGIRGTGKLRASVSIHDARSVQLRHLFITGTDRGITISGSSSVEAQWLTVSAGVGHAVEARSSLLTLGADNLLESGTAPDAAAIFAESSTINVNGAGNELRAMPGEPESTAATLAVGSAMSASNGIGLIFSGLVKVTGGSSLSLAQGEFLGPVHMSGSSDMVLGSLEPEAGTIGLRDFPLTISTGASARLLAIQIAPRVVAVETNAVLYIVDSSIRTNTLGISLGGTVELVGTLVDGDVAVSAGGIFSQGLGSSVSGVVGCSSAGLCL